MSTVQVAGLTPMWVRIANGEVDLSRYTDEEILTGEIYMADGRRLPTPPTFPDVWVREQIKRGLRKAERTIREGAMTALDVYREILEDDTLEPKDRLKAADFFTTRFLGKPDQHVHVHTPDLEDAREVLIQRLLAARQGLPVHAVQQLASGQPVEDVVDAEVLSDATITLDDLL